MGVRNQPFLATYKTYEYKMTFSGTLKLAKLERLLVPMNEESCETYKIVIAMLVQINWTVFKQCIRHAEREETI